MTTLADMAQPDQWVVLVADLVDSKVVEIQARKIYSAAEIYQIFLVDSLAVAAGSVDRVKVLT
jgi:hypothetical protein